MSTEQPVIPKRLRDDSIVEAICEVRFSSDDLGEIVVGRLADADPWRQFSKERLPLSEVPSELRKLNPQLRFTPTLALKGQNRIVQVGECVLSHHVTTPYCGWERWRPEIHSVVELLFTKLTNVNISRIGLRYINALTPKRHSVEGVRSLEVEASAAGERITEDLNLNFKKSLDQRTTVLTRIATKSFVEGKLPPEVSVVVDVDVFTPDGVSLPDPKSTIEWIEAAHDYEKRTFFSLIPKKIIADLIVD